MKITNKNIVSISASSKTEALKKIAIEAKKLKITSSATALEKAFVKREKEFSTGFENGFAIPHARISEISKSSIIVVKFKYGIDWKSMDKKKTEVAIVICVPKNELSADKHMKSLSAISGALIDLKFQKILKTGTKSEIVEVVNTSLENTVEHKKVAKNAKIKVVAITACSTGIAHTFMAAKKLQEVANSKNIKIKVQTNGASGPENVLLESDILEADYAIIAADVKVDESVFDGKKVIKVPVAYAIKNANDLLDNLESESSIQRFDTKNKHNKKKQNQKSSWIYRNILTHIMNGVSHIIPLLVSAGVLLALGKLLGSFTGDIKIADNYGKLSAIHGTENIWFKFVYFINIMGLVTLWFMFPVFGLFTAESIAGKSAIIPGFIVGVLADGDHIFARIWRTFNGTNPKTNPFMKDSFPFVQSSAGFFGVLVGAILIGYFVFWLNKSIKIKGALAPLKSILIVPGLAIIVTVILQTFVINPPFALLNKGITNLAKNSTTFIVGFGVFVAICTAFDLGGPINKAVGSVAIGLAVTGTIPLTARTMSIVIPPLGLGLATLLAKPIFKKDLYDEDLKIAGRTSLFLGLIAITEGGLPFLFKRPVVTIVASIVGAVIGSTFAVLIGAQMWQPLPAIYGWGLVGTSPSNAAVTSNLAIWAQILVYILGIIIGAFVTALSHIGGILIADKIKNKIRIKRKNKGLVKV